MPDPGDISGVPYADKKDKVTDFFINRWLKDACDNPVILFLDEIDRADIQIRQAIFELTDSRKYAGHHLHENTLIFGAVNSGEHAAQYQVGGMDPAEVDRWIVFDVEPSIEDWLEWGKTNNNIVPIVLDFITNFPEHLEHKGDFEPNKIYPSRRSWKRLSDCLSQEENIIKPGEVSRTLFAICNAFIGLEATHSFADYIRKYQKIITPQDIIDDGRIELTNKFNFNEHLALIQMMENKASLKKVLNEKQIQNLVKYFNSLPSEIMIKLWDLVSKEEESLTNVKNLHVFVKDRLIECMSSIKE
jgi:hypothetical protein